MAVKCSIFVYIFRKRFNQAMLSCPERALVLPRLLPPSELDADQCNRVRLTGARIFLVCN